MRAGQVRLPSVARVLVAAAASGALVCTVPALADPGRLEWGVLLPLAALYAICEFAPRCPLMGHKVPGNMGAFFPVLLTAVFLTPAAAAALVPVPGALIGHVAPGHTAARRVWHAAQLALAVWTSAQVWNALGGSVTVPDLAGTGFPAVLPAAAATALTFCAVVTVLDGAILVAAERCALRAAWRGQFHRAVAPHLLHGFVGLMMAVLWRSSYGPAAAFFVLLPMYICCWVFAQYHRERAAHQATIRALVQAVDIKDRYTRGHSERVGRASVLIARELGMDDERTEALRFAGILHDIGKLGVPTRLLRKEGPLTPEERRVIELHPEYGHEMVRGIGFLDEARDAILHHHERLDGSGYPFGLAGAEIPEFARVVAVADAFDAMTSTRSYRRARPVAAAVAELKRCAGTQFDPRMVRALAGALERQEWSPAVTTDRPWETGRPAGAEEPGRNVPAARDQDEPVAKSVQGTATAETGRGALRRPATGSADETAARSAAGPAIGSASGPASGPGSASAFGSSADPPPGSSAGTSGIVDTAGAPGTAPDPVAEAVAEADAVRPPA